MDREKLIQHYMAQGIPAEQAAQLADSTLGLISSGADEDKLTKAMTELRDAWERSAEAQFEDRLQKALQVERDIAGSVSAGADALVAEVKEQNDALFKGFLAGLENQKAQRDEIAKLTEGVDFLNKSMAKLFERMNEPLPTRAIRTADEIVPAPSEQTQPGAQTEATFDDVLMKANTEISAPGTTDDRKRTLQRAVSMLYAGQQPDVVAKSYQINLS